MALESPVKPSGKFIKAANPMSSLGGVCTVMREERECINFEGSFSCLFFFQMNDFSWETCLYFHFFLLQMCSKWEGLCWVSCSFFALIQILLKPSYPAENGLFPLKNIPKHKALSAQTAEKKMKACLTFQEYLVLLPKSHSAPGNAIPMSALSLTSSPVVPSAASALPILPPA